LQRIRKNKGDCREAFWRIETDQGTADLMGQIRGRIFGEETIWGFLCVKEI
jgi:hypothetical protein